MAKKLQLTVVFRVEPGCLGPEGENTVIEFCSFAQEKINPIKSICIHWLIIPRDRKTDPEIQYKVGDKTLTREKAEKYLQIFKLNSEALEQHLLDNITDLIEQFLSH